MKRVERKVGKVYLVGAGPGDYKLLTLRGKECLEKAEVLVYDRLVNPRLVSYCSPNTEMIYAGKESSRHAMTQEEINQCLVDKAQQGLTVVRLKGGDPFVFGRGGEEAECLRLQGIPFEVVPGITSAIAVPAYAGIPVTHRKMNTMFSVITGHEDPTKAESQMAWSALASLGGTLVFLMGLENLPSIVSQLQIHGLAGGTPCAVIEKGTLPAQKVLQGDLQSIVEDVERAGMKPPVIVVVGEVVQLREHLAWFEQRPLFGKKIAVTRARRQASALVTELEELGAEVFETPAIEIIPVDDLSPLDRAIGNLNEYDWLIFTSVNAVEIFINRLFENGHDVRALAGRRTAAIGTETANLMVRNGLQADIVPSRFYAEELATAVIRESAPGQRVLLPRAQGAREILPLMLRNQGLTVEEIEIYQAKAPENLRDRISSIFRTTIFDAVTFTSSSTVHNLLTLLADDAVAMQNLSKAGIACIGPITATTANANGLKVDVVAEEFTIKGLVRVLTKYFEQDGRETERRSAL